MLTRLSSYLTGHNAQDPNSAIGNQGYYVRVYHNAPSLNLKV